MFVLPLMLTAAAAAAQGSEEVFRQHSCGVMEPLRPAPPELLSQLSGVRRSAGGQLSSGPSASQLQQLQMQLQLERQQAQAARQQLETARNASRGGGRANAILNANSVPANPNPSVNHNSNASPNPGPAEPSTQHNSHSSHSSQFLLSRWGTEKISGDHAPTG